MNQLFQYITDFHQKHRVATHLLFWLLVYGLGIFTTATSEGQPLLNFKQNIVWHLMMMVSKIPFAYLVVYVTIPLFFDKKKYLLAIFLFFGVYYLNFCLSTSYKILVYPHFEMFVVNGIEEFSYKHFFRDYFFSNLGAGAAMVLVKLLLNRTEINHKALTLEKQKAEIELKLLKTQLNPHFLFNTLNNIYTLSLLNSPKTSESIARLSEILDYILYRCNVPKVPLKNEIKLIENYIALEKLRYDERLEVSFKKNIEKEVEIAPLILLTFVENAFKHGAGEDAGSPQIAIELFANESKLVFCIENTVKPSAKQTKSSDVGIGLKNLRQQLSLIYGEKYGLEIQQTGHHFKVVLTIQATN